MFDWVKRKALMHRSKLQRNVYPGLAARPAVRGAILASMLAEQARDSMARQRAALTASRSLRDAAPIAFRELWEWGKAWCSGFRSARHRSRSTRGLPSWSPSPTARSVGQARVAYTSAIPG